MKQRYLAAFLLLSTWATMASGQTAFNPGDVAVKADQENGALNENARSPAVQRR